MDFIGVELHDWFCNKAESDNDWFRGEGLEYVLILKCGCTA
jgi:hypothetical protein